MSHCRLYVPSGSPAKTFCTKSQGRRSGPPHRQASPIPKLSWPPRAGPTGASRHSLPMGCQEIVIIPSDVVLRCWSVILAIAIPALVYPCSQRFPVLPAAHGFRPYLVHSAGSSSRRHRFEYACHIDRLFLARTPAGFSEVVVIREQRISLYGDIAPVWRPGGADGRCRNSGQELFDFRCHGSR